MEEKKADGIVEALARAKAKFGTVKRSETADTGRYKYKYATLDAMIEATEKALAEEGLVVVHSSEADADGKLLIVTATIRGKGEAISASVPMPYPMPDGRMNPAQAMGSTLTYGRRYSYGALLGLAIEDDDDAARAPEAKPKEPAKASEPSAASQFSEALSKAKGIGAMSEDQCKMAAAHWRSLSVDERKAKFSELIGEITKRIDAHQKANAADPETLF